eukprot:2632885-Amphidinium_carterae.1
MSRDAGFLPSNVTKRENFKKPKHGGSFEVSRTVQDRGSKLTRLPQPAQAFACSPRLLLLTRLGCVAHRPQNRFSLGGILHARRTTVSRKPNKKLPTCKSVESHFLVSSQQELKKLMEPLESFLQACIRMRSLINIDQKAPAQWHASLPTRITNLCTLVEYLLDLITGSISAEARLHVNDLLFTGHEGFEEWFVAGVKTAFS